MPKAIKAFNVSTTVSATPYTCPANTVAKVIVQYFSLAHTTTATSQRVSSIAFGETMFSVKTTSATSITRTYGNLGAEATTSDVVSTLDQKKEELLLIAGEAVSIVLSANQMTSTLAKCKFVVIEEVAS